MNRQSSSRLGLVLLFFLTVGIPVGSATVPYEPPRLFLSIAGEINFLDDGDFGRMVTASGGYYGSLHDPASGREVSLEEGPAYRGIEVEIGIQAGRYGVGIGVGSLRRAFSLTYAQLDPADGTGEHLSWERRFSATPLMIYNHFDIWRGGMLSLRIDIGGGVYLARYRDDRLETTQGVSSVQTKTITTEADRNLIGLHLGACLEIHLGRTFTLFAEVMGRWVDFKDITATRRTDKDGEISEKEGEMGYITDGETGEGMFWVGIYDDPWTGGAAQLALKGLALRAGVKITLGRSGK